MKIDIFNHLFPRRFFEEHIAGGAAGRDIGKRVQNIPTIVDLDKRFRALDEFGRLDGSHTAWLTTTDRFES